VTYADKLTGKLMLYYGTADNNVHPTNTFQLVEALETNGKRYDLQVGPDRGHSGMNPTRQWEYFVTHLIVQPPKDSLAQAYDRRRRRLAVARQSAGSD
jgi:dipeptidyl-peptidase-4